ncbi:TolC family protein [Allopusillimonas ginsengisoli]|uniref:TolC family protein n=1 Tax=Allopusillimonas ginsengisoli TaxID=453575 RepID=UPI0039C1986E
MKLLAGIAIMAWTLPVFGNSLATPPDLPPTASVRQWIEQDPAVQEARTAQRAAGHTAAMIAASPNEWTASLAAQRRSFQGGGPTSNEWHVQLERPIRINGKAGLDQQLGEVERVIAQARVGEAIQESARALLDLWIDGLTALQAQKLLKEQETFAQANLRAVEKRKKAGDASALDISVAATDFADAQRQANTAASTLEKVRAKLRIRYPGAQLPAKLLSDPIPLSDMESQWQERVLEAADPLHIAQAQLHKAKLTASRASADRVPDPTVGVFAASEAFRNERIVGISISIPFGGTYRNERMRQSLQEVEVARAAVGRQRRDLQSGVAETYANATGNFARWQLAKQAAAATAESARLIQRAYSLGEADMQSLLLVRRQFLDASRAALEARAEALRANYRLLIDAHQIWDLAPE